jgi:hypothetical protein
MRRLLFILACVAGCFAIAIPANARPAPHLAPVQTTLGEALGFGGPLNIPFGTEYGFTNVAYSPRGLYAHAHTSILQDSTTPQPFQLINAATINGTTYGELEIGTTGLCAEYSPTTLYVYAESCVPGTGYELVSVRTPVGGNQPENWIVPEPYDGNPPSGFWTDNGPSQSYEIQLHSGGAGNYAIWDAYVWG